MAIEVKPPPITQNNLTDRRRKRALITGVTGQDGSYLADYLLDLDYVVFGFVRRTSKPNFENIQQLLDHPNFYILYGDLTDQGSINRAMLEALPDEIYNLAAQSFVGGSWQYPATTADITGLGALRILEAIRQFNPKARYYQASSSEMFGQQGQGYMALDEDSLIMPRSPYGTAKAFAHYTTINYRESYGLHASCGILFNHESPRRGLEFVTRKITDAVAKIHLGKQQNVTLGNIEASRDWGDARDYVRAMHLMLQQDEPGVYVIASGETHSIKEFLAMAFEVVDRNYQDYVETDPALFRPAEIDVLLGSPGKARKVLGWKPRISLRQMVSDMVKADIERNK